MHRTENSIALTELPDWQAILAAYHFEVSVDIGARESLDFVSIVGLNEFIDAFHVPASLLLRYARFWKIVQKVIEEAWGRVVTISNSTDTA